MHGRLLVCSSLRKVNFRCQWSHEGTSSHIIQTRKEWKKEAKLVRAPRGPVWGPHEPSGDLFLGQFGLFPTLAGPCLVVWEVGSEEQGGWCAHPCASAATTSGWGCWVPPSRAPPPSSAAMRSSGTPSTPQSSKNKVNPGQTMQYQTENTTTTSYKSHDSDTELIITLSFLNLHLSCWAGDYM